MGNVENLDVVAGTVNNGNGNRFLNRDFVVARYNVNDAPAVALGGECR